MAAAELSSVRRFAEFPVEGVDAHVIFALAARDGQLEGRALPGLEAEAEPGDLLGDCASARIELIHEELDTAYPVEAHVVDVAGDEGAAGARGHLPLEAKDLFPIDLERGQ